MIVEKFEKNGIHYIKEAFDSGTTNTYPDPDFNIDSTPELLPKPDLSTPDKKLDFIIFKLNLLSGYQP